MGWVGRLFGNLCFVFLGVVFEREYERLESSQPIEMIGSFTIAPSSIYAGLLIASLVGILIFNWSVLKYIAGYWRRRQTRIMNEEKQFRKNIVRKMIILRELILHNPGVPRDSPRGSPESSSLIEIHIRELDKLGLSAPKNFGPNRWLVHLERLIPFVQAYGVEGAKEEMKEWYPE